jgi:HlyD family secretion protein
MIRTYVLPVVALFGLLFAIGTVVRGAEPTPVAQPVAQPARAPFPTFLAGAGIVESASENIAVGTPVSGIVMSVAVKAGDRVDAGTALFQLDIRDLDASRVVAEARVKEAAAMRERARTQLALAESVRDPRAISAEELVNRRSALAIADASQASAQAEVQRLGIEIERRTVRALAPGRVLQVKVRPGEMALAGVLATPLVLLGDDERPRVRVDVDENDAWRFRPGAAAVAHVRGNPALSAKLRYERVEPFVVPKVSLTGQSSERVDTRVLQVLYSFDGEELPVYVGQQMDVFVEAPSGDVAPEGGGDKASPQAPAEKRG